MIRVFLCYIRGYVLVTLVLIRRYTGKYFEFSFTSVLY